MDVSRNFFGDAAKKAGVDRYDGHRVEGVYASALLEPTGDSLAAFSTRSANEQLAFPPRMRQKLADVPMTGARLRRAALPPPPDATHAHARRVLATDVMFEFLTRCYKPWLARPTQHPPTDRSWAWRTDRNIAGAMVVQDDGVEYVLKRMLVRNVQGHLDRATAAEVRHRPPAGAHARAPPQRPSHTAHHRHPRRLHAPTPTPRVCRRSERSSESSMLANMYMTDLDRCQHHAHLGGDRPMSERPQHPHAGRCHG